MRVRVGQATTPLPRDDDPLDAFLRCFEALDGYVAVALGDARTGLTMAMRGEERFDVDVAVAANAHVLRVKEALLPALHLSTLSLEDIVITLATQYHLIFPSKTYPTLFFYVVLDRTQGNLALTLRHLKKLDAALVS